MERGTHAELMALGGRYRTLYDKQYSFEADRFINPGRGLHARAAAVKVSAPVRPDSGAVSARIR